MKADETGKQTSIYPQVNTGNDPAKHGFSAEQALAAAEQLSSLEKISLDGVMTIPPFVQDENILKPIFEKSSCYDCHDGADPENKKNKALNLAKNDSIKEDIEVGNADASELILRLTDKEDPMPPKGDMLNQEDVQKIKDWINAGAKF